MIGTKNHPAVGKRIEIPAYADMWMRGARFGVVERVVIGRGNYLDPRDPRGATIFRVRLDRPQAAKVLRGYVADDCRYI